MGLSLKWLPLAKPMQQPTKNRGTSNGVGFLTRFCLSGTLGEDNYQSFSMAIQAIKNIMKKIHSVAIDGHQMMKRHVTTNQKTVLVMGGGIMMR